MIRNGVADSGTTCTPYFDLDRARRFALYEIPLCPGSDQERRLQFLIQFETDRCDSVVTGFTEEARWKIVFEDGLTFVFIENDPQRRVKAGGQAVACHSFRCQRIADLIL